MWTRRELKACARDNLKKYFWPAVGVWLITLLLTGWQTVFNITSYDVMGYQEALGVDLSDMLAFTSVLEQTRAGLWISLITALFGIFIGNVLSVGVHRYFLVSREMGASAGVSEIFWGFGSGHYWNIVKTMFMKNLFLIFWTMFFVIPGIIKGLEYSMIPYILAENPSLSREEVFSLTRRMTYGNKSSIFLLELSFLGWIFLGTLLLGLGLIPVQCYMTASMTELYMWLKMDRTPNSGLDSFRRDTHHSY